MRKQMVGCSMLAGVKSWPWLPGRRGGSTRWRDGSLQPPSGDPSFFHLSSSRPGCAATCATAWLTWKAGTSKPTWPSWIVLWWGPAISQPPRQKGCSISTATSSSEWHCSALKLRTKTKATGRVLLGEQNWSALGSVLRGGGRAWVVFSPSGSTRFQIFGLAKNASSQPLEVFTFPKGCTPLVVKLYLVISE